MLRPPPRYAPVAETLEPRCVPAAIGVTLSVSPEILRPILPANEPHAVVTQHVLPVTLAGDVTVAEPGAVTLHYQVIDQYGHYQPSGVIEAEPVNVGEFFFSARIGLSDVRHPRIPGGRHYEVIVTAENAEGTATASALVTVPPPGFYTATPRHPGAKTP